MRTTRKNSTTVTVGVRFAEVSDDVNSLYKTLDFRLLFTTLLYLACVQTPSPKKN